MTLPRRPANDTAPPATAALHDPNGALVEALVATLTPVLRSALRERLPALLREARPTKRRARTPVTEDDRRAADAVDEVTRARARELLKGRR